MKSKLFLLIVIAFMLIPATCISQENTKSYYCKQMGTAGQIPTVPQNMSAVVTFWGDNTLIVNIGTTLFYDFSYTSSDGVRHYTFREAQGMVMPNTNYTELLFSSDYGFMRILYVFGMPGMWTQMYQDYQYLGEGAQPALDWSRGY